MSVLPPSLVSLLLCSPSPEAPQRYLQAIPESASFVLLVPDVPDLVERASSSTWAEFVEEQVLDEGWSGLVDELIEATEDPFFDALVPIVSEVEAAAFYASMDHDVAGIALQLEGARDLVVDLLEEHAPELDVDELESPQVVVLDEGDDLAVVYVIDEVAVVLFSDDPDVLDSEAEASLESLRSEGVSGIAADEHFERARAGAPGGSHIEFYLRIQEILESEGELDDPTMQEFFEDMLWWHGALWIGPDESFEAQLSIYHGENNLLASVLGVFEPASSDLLHFIPEDSISVTSGGMDLEAAVDVVFEMMEVADAPTEEVEASMQALADQLGFHPRDDLLPLFTGDMAGFSRELSSYLEGRDDVDLEEVVNGSALLGLSDGDEFLEYFDAFLSQFGLDALLESDEIDGVEVYSLPYESGQVLNIGVANDFLAICGSEADMQDVIDVLNDKAPSVLENERLGPALTELEGTRMYTLMDTAASIGTMIEVMQVVLQREQFGDEYHETLNEKLGGLTDSGAVAEAFQSLLVYSMSPGRAVTTVRLETF